MLQCTEYNLLLLLGGLAQAISPIATHFSVAWSVGCLSSVVCHTRAPCLIRSTDLDVIWQTHLWGPMTHCVRWGSCAPGEGRFGGHNPSENMELEIAAVTWRIETRSNSAFFQITLDLLWLLYTRRVCRALWAWSVVIWRTGAVSRLYIGQLSERVWRYSLHYMSFIQATHVASPRRRQCCRLLRSVITNSG